MPPINARFNGIDHVVFKVTDIGRTTEFYRSVLGLRVERIFEKIGLHQVRCGINLIDLLELPPGAALPPPAERGIEHVCLSIEADMDELLRDLASHEVAVIRGPMEVYGARGFGTSIYILDPDSYEIELKVGYSQNPARFA
jgi:glyoxylase I family protein